MIIEDSCKLVKRQLRAVKVCVDVGVLKMEDACIALYVELKRAFETTMPLLKIMRILINSCLRT